MKDNKSFNLFQKKEICSGNIKLEYTLEESIFLIEQLLRIPEDTVNFELNKLNEFFCSKFKKAYTVEQYKQMAKTTLVLKGKCSLRLHLITNCDYGNGNISFQKGQFFILSQCVLLSPNGQKQLKIASQEYEKHKKELEQEQGIPEA